MSSAPSPDHDQQILAIGRQCSHTSCLLVDFLPFKCQHCANSFCAEHFKPESHNCSKYDVHKYNRVAPDCPLCNEPVPIPPGEDPNIRMERHLTADCSVMTGRSHKASASPKCSRPKCGKVLFAQIQCDKCRQKFCPEHRFPNSHNCSSLSSLAAPASIGNTSSKASSQVSAISASGMAAMRRAAASAKSAVPSPSTKTSTDKGKATSSASSAASGSKRNTPNLFSKTDRTSPPDAKLITDKSDTTAETPARCSPKPQTISAFDFNSRSKQERESQIRAMRARAQKGLLSEEEKVLLASLEAKRGHGSGDKDCVVM